MIRIKKVLQVLVIVSIISSCVKREVNDQYAQTSSSYYIEMDSTYKISRYTYLDIDESINNDDDAVCRYYYYQDSIIIIRDSREITQRDDILKTKYYINERGLADSAYAVFIRGSLPFQYNWNYYSYDDSSYLISDSTIAKDYNNTILSSSVWIFEYTDGNNTKLTGKYSGTTISSTTYTYNTTANMVSLFGSFKGRPNKNLVKSSTYNSDNLTDYVTTTDYLMNQQGLVEVATSTSYLNSVRLDQFVRYEYVVSKK